MAVVMGGPYHTVFEFIRSNRVFPRIFAETQVYLRQVELPVRELQGQPRVVLQPLRLIGVVLTFDLGPGPQSSFRSPRDYPATP
jgi:hypothetical protein